ncbi:MULTISPECIES: polysaccharide biosynthesis protein [Enterococcus]|uniref:hypothetical protein n=1 Tax=Enterococcus TaxID=1350 RepID=UPI0010FF90F4|nr:MULTISPECIES: hypothetical protein [Enterococcus]QCT93185.1 hypothetical protein FE005_15095 [Enterococcus sp. M190262]GMG57298.1 hypothetical protein AH4_07210 [Enterococcus gallinarum]
MNKTRKSLLNAITSVLLSLINGLTSIIVIQKIIEIYGSDFNGLNSTVNQLINMLLVVEGGFTLAISVSLFAPLTNDDFDLINRILSASEKIFKKIGWLFLLLGTIVTIIASILIKSNLPYTIIFLSFYMMVVSTFINLYFSTKYRIVLQTDLKEYIINLFQAFFLVISQLIILFVISIEANMLYIRFVMMMSAVMTSVSIIIYVKRRYSQLSFSEIPDFEGIKGTKDVFVQKITSVLYGAFPMIFISMTVGTKFASVYIVYNNIFSLVKSIIYSVVNAPRIGFGRIISEKDKKYVYKVFSLYEFSILTILMYALLCLAVLIRPFMNLYTRNMADQNYNNQVLIIIMILVMFFEVIHIPSGNIINMAGKFKIGKRIQTIAAICLIGMMLVFNIFYGFYGILFAILCTAILLAVLEIGYIYKVFFQMPLKAFLTPVLKMTLFCFFVFYFQNNICSFEINNFFNLFCYGLLVALINGGLLLLYIFIFEKNKFLSILAYTKGVFNKK